jgi:hypothetical protein
VPRPFPKRISEIKPTLTNLALTSNYMVEFGGLGGNLRSYLRDKGLDSRFIGETMGLLCNSAILPGSSFATADIVGNFMGVSEKFAHTRTFTQMDLSFYVDTKYNSLKFLEHWIEFISSGSTTNNRDNASPLRNGYYFRMRYPNEYKCDETRIIKFERDYNRYIEYRFFGLFPIALNSTSVSYEGSNLLKASATFHYDRYVSGLSRSFDQSRRIDNNRVEGNRISNTSSSRPTTEISSRRLDNGVASPNNASLSMYGNLLSNNQFGTLSEQQVLNSQFSNSFRKV